MSTKYSADDMPSIAQRLKEIEAEKMAAIMGKPLEDPKPVEAPADIDWTGMYAPCGYTSVATPARYFVGVPSGGTSKSVTIKIADLPPYTPSELKSLAHPEWPYAGTGHEWRVRIKS